MKTLIKKTLLVLMVAFIAVFTLGVSSKVKAAEVARFDFGQYDSSKTNEGSQDGSSASSYTEEVGTYTLTLSSLTNVYKGSYDAKGNSCLKLGTSKKTGSFSFTVPNDVTEVGILVAGYKSSNVTVSVNGASTSITTKSANGEYTEVKADTSTNKTVSFVTSTNYRCKIDAIVYYVTEPSTNPSLSILGDVDAMVGTDLILTATKLNTTSEVVWSSSDDTVATVANGVVTPLKAGTVTITAELVDDSRVSAQHKLTIYPDNKTIKTIEEAVSICEMMSHNTYTPYKYTIQGSVTSVVNEEYGNLNLKDNTGTIYVYGLYQSGVRYDAMVTKPVVDDEIVIEGPLGQYNGTMQMKNAELKEIILEDNVNELINALNNIKSYMSIAYKYNVEDKPSTFSISYKTSLVSLSELVNMDDTTTADTFNLNPDVFSVKGDKGSCTNNVGLATNGTIRLYSNRKDGNGNSLTISTKNGEIISSISIEFGSDTTDFTVNGVESTSEVTDYNINSNSVIIKNVYEDATAEKNLQLHIKSITINVETEVDKTYSDGEFRLKFGIDEDIASLSTLVNSDNLIWGLEITDGINTKQYNSSNEFLQSDNENGVKYVVLSLGDVLKNINYANTEFTVSAYVIFDGKQYTSTSSKTYSVVSMIKEYNTNEEYAKYKDQIAPLVEVLSSLGCKVE